MQSGSAPCSCHCPKCSNSDGTHIWWSSHHPHSSNLQESPQNTFKSRSNALALGCFGRCPNKSKLLWLLSAILGVSWIDSHKDRMSCKKTGCAKSQLSYSLQVYISQQLGMHFRSEEWLGFAGRYMTATKEFCHSPLECHDTIHRHPRLPNSGISLQWLCICFSSILSNQILHHPGGNKSSQANPGWPADLLSGPTWPN